MVTTSVTHRGVECFGSSLANYFEATGLEDLGRRVYSAFREHLFVARDGSIDPLLSTRLVRDLTDGQYQGTLHHAGLERSLPRLIRELGREEAYVARTVIAEETHWGRLIEEERISYLGSAVLFNTFVPGASGKRRIANEGIAVALPEPAPREPLYWTVDDGKGHTIRNGNVADIDNPSLFLQGIQAVLEIERV